MRTSADRQLSTTASNVALAALLAALPAASLAQSTSTGTTSVGPWHIEVHAGASRPGGTSEGTSRLPPPGPTFNTINVRPTRRVPSWFFGDGALLHNQVAAALGLPASSRIVPLDPVLTSAGLVPSTGAEFGVRVGRRLTGPLSVEFSFDYQPSALELDPDVTRSVEATEASFRNAWGGFFGHYPFLQGHVDAYSDVRARETRRITAVATVNADLPSWGSLTPYVTAGAGGVFDDQGPSTVALSGHYFTVHPNGALAQGDIDDVVVRYTPGRRSLAGVIGGGVTGDLGSSLGWRVDGRVLVSANRQTVTVTASPFNLPLVPGSAFATGTDPGLQLSSLPGVSPSLGGDTVDAFETFRGSGLTFSSMLTAGIFVRVPQPRAASAAAPGEPPRPVELGVKGGISASSLDVSGFPDQAGVDRRLTGAVGGYVRIAPEAPFSFQPEVFYAARGATVRYGDEEIRFRFTYLDLPLLARIRLTRGTTGPYVIAGPSVGLRLEARAESGDYDQPLESDTRPVDIGATLGGGVSLSVIHVDVRYTWGLRNMLRDELAEEGLEFKNRSLAVFVGFRLW